VTTTRPALIAALLLLAALPVRAQDRTSFFNSYGLPTDEMEETIRLAVGGGLNLSPELPGWQGTFSVMGENRDKALLTQISLSFETVGTQAAGESSPSGRISQVTLNPLSIFFGYGGVRIGGGFDLSWSFLPSGRSAENATGFGWGGRAGGGIVLRPGPVNVWALCQYRWLSGDRVGGVFFDLLIGPEW
jgi:hypothetical protein